MTSCQPTISKGVGYVMGVGLLLVLLGAIPASAARCRVPSSAYPTIQAAVDNATCATINVAAGTYHENVVINHDVTIRGEESEESEEGEGQESTIVDGSGSGTVFTITSGKVTIKNVTIQNGLGPVGGGIVNNGGMLTIKDSTISNNSALEGGGISNNGTVTLKDVTFQNNTPNDCTGCP